jgi:glc operon protein GlcG
MYLKPVLDLADAETAQLACNAHAHRLEACVSMAVVDGAGHLLAFQRMEGAPIISIETAIAKARMAAYFAKPTLELETSINGPRPAFMQLSGLQPQSCVAIEGGLPLLQGRHCVGAIGVSGVTSEMDAAIAQAGLNTLPTSQP